MKAPEFTLPDSDGNVVDSSSLKGAKTILFFYPKAMTPGCTGEACDFRDDHQRFLDAGYRVIGVSPDPRGDNARFKAEHRLPFPLLSDEDHAVAEAFGAWGTKVNYGKEYEGLIRSTFVISEDGEIEQEYRNVRAKGHVARLARELLGD